VLQNGTVTRNLLPLLHFTYEHVTWLLHNILHLTMIAWR